MKIILLGYMASGKSTIGRLLAADKKMLFIDLDAYIEEKEGISISNIFKNKGEIYFRIQENKYLKELLTNDNSFILSLGGGTPCYAGNMEVINDAVKVSSFYLRASIKTIVARLASEEKVQRPLVADLSDEKLVEFISKHLFERSYFYEQAAYKIQIDEKNVNTIAEEISKILH